MNNNVSVSTENSRPDIAGLLALPLRLVVGWTYFSAFWRRVALENKLDPDVSGYVGEKFNHFLPHALGIKPIIGFLIEHPDLLRWSMIIFTVVEGITGLCLMAGILARAMSVSVFLLALGILLGSGWLGTTCLDEWQIGILGIASGLTLFLSGGGRYSVDHYVAERHDTFTKRNWFTRLASGPVDVSRHLVLGGAAAVLAIALFTNQYFHGGLYGPLHNKSVAPVIEISDAHISDRDLRFTVYRTEGVDVYGSFLVGVTVTESETGRAVVDLRADQLSRLPAHAITNRYIAAVKTGAHGVIVPLGAKAELNIEGPHAPIDPRHHYTLSLADVSGAVWVQGLQIGD
ncbi:TQO small subunit DoxD [Mycobacteroides franklinii]|uniref:TQO small subunit DoxD n=1 Tax=Mycobacteroides franklinii TaxID=948102 RepID=UPI000991D0D6|nr:TQO small subunit DoxD [Mycobacteroides franklinii]